MIDSASDQHQDGFRLSDLEPVARYRVIDLVSEAGHSTEDWANFAGGPSKASANPRYCYEWCFIETGKPIILNAWYEDMDERDGTVFLPLNIQNDIRLHSMPGGKAVWLRRAEKLDSTLRYAYREAASMRLIICKGQRRQKDRQDAERSHVRARELDSALWSVTSYNYDTGDCLIARGISPTPVVDQFDLMVESDLPADFRMRSGKAYRRSQEVRRRVLERARGRCEFCEADGFRLSDGTKFLEIHHVRPLSDGGSDSILNVVALCANHHREVHYGERRKHIGTVLKAKARLGRSEPRANAV